MDWTEILGEEPDDFCGRLYAKRPEWVQGTISLPDARYLFKRTLAAAPQSVVELGTASGLSTVFLCHALQTLADAGRITTDYRVSTYDVSTAFYADPSLPVGQAAREMLPEGLLEQVEFRNPATSVDIRDEQSPDGISFLFIDANHQHPWPTLDLLAVLDVAAPGTEIVLHDVNLPFVHPAFQAWGVNHLFEGVQVEKLLNPEEGMPNIGSIWIPDQKAELRGQLLALLHGHDWEVAPFVDILHRIEGADRAHVGGGARLS